MDIVALLSCLHPCLTPTTLRHLTLIVHALLCMTGRVTISGIARWTDTGASCRTLQRFFATSLSWPLILWRLFLHHHFHSHHIYILAGDETLVSKSGKKTHGLDRFFSSILQKPIPSVAFFCFALVDTTTRRAVPLSFEQVVRSDAEKAAAKAKTAKTPTQPPVKRPVGRPKGSKTKTKTEYSLSPELQRIQCLLHDLLARMGDTLSITYLALDGHFGTAPAIAMVRGCGLHIVSKLRSNAALYLPYEGPYQGRGPRRKYGEKVDLKALPERFLRERSVEDGSETRMYQMEALQKEVAEVLNVVVLVKTNLKTHKRAHVVLFSSDRTLGYAQVIEYYGLRFQIEFVFRDAKQYWGLEDFMTVTATGVRNAANLAVMMVSVSRVLVREGGASSVLDLKASFRGSRYVAEALKLLPELLDVGLIEQIYGKVASLGRIHPPDDALKAA